MPILHPSLRPLRQLPGLLGRPVGFISQEAHDPVSWLAGIRIWVVRQFLNQQIKHLQMARDAWQDRTSDFFLMLDHNPIYSIPLYLALWLKGKPVFFFVHEIQQKAQRTGLNRFGFFICRLWVRSGEFYPVHIALDDSLVEPRFRFPAGKILTIPHPHAQADFPPAPRPARTKDAPLTVGVVGMVRKGKPLDRILQVLLEARKKMDFQLVVGTPFFQKPAWMDELPVAVMNTDTLEEYDSCLARLDVYVVDFAKEDYYFRPSGVITDAAMRGCYVICPDYPVFLEQITRPVVIGATFKDPGEIPGLLERARTDLADGFPSKIERWREPARITEIARLFWEFLERRKV